MKWKLLLPFTDLFSRRFDLKILNWQVFWLTSLFAAFPSRRIETVAGIAKSSLRGLQLRVQLRYRTGFPFQTHFRNRKFVNQVIAKVENIPEEPLR